MKDKIDKLVQLGKQANVSPDFYDHLDEIKKEIEELSKLKKQKESKNDV